MSSRINIRSNLERRAAGRLMFFYGVYDLLYRENKGFAAAKTDVLAFRVVVRPAFAIDTVCCSMT